MHITHSALSLFLLSIYVFLLPFGNLQRLGAGEGSYGVSSILFIALVLLGLRHLKSTVTKNAEFRMLAYVIGWAIFASVFSQERIDAFLTGVNFFLYLCVGILAYRYVRNYQSARTVLYSYLLGCTLVAIISLLDFYGFVAINEVNSRQITTELGELRLSQLLGPFARRSALAAYFTLYVAISFSILLFFPTRNLTKVILIACTLLGFSILFLSHNRGSLLALLIFALVAVTFLFGVKRGLRSILVLAGLSLFVWLLLSNPLREAVYVYQFALLELVETGGGESDRLRIDLIFRALESLLSFPLGQGFSNITGLASLGGEAVNPHSLIAALIWSAGVYGVFCLFLAGFFLVRVYHAYIKHSELVASNLGKAFFLILLAYLAYNLTHFSLANGVFWIIIGAFLAFYEVLKKSVGESLPIS